ncbi:MbtH family NRPS accessory protein [Streptomyces sp. NA04227]|uniref:MbtH family NRPS accessory protein n=1 Tax=Streptomyces sp. NA04227 TaxID=2742136 RepID=UPI001591D6FA|nr:MbtH family NRPS accessory protein [Streptomyces sp. NA04227]QKW08923.1 MbtH family NRPS accessory protein [Streptomyces sp. NA04227]
MENSVKDETEYVVVVNVEEQYSIWPTHQDIPTGWRALDIRAQKAECLNYIERTWTDMRPQSLRGPQQPTTEG